MTLVQNVVNDVLCKDHLKVIFSYLTKEFFVNLCKDPYCVFIQEIIHLFFVLQMSLEVKFNGVSPNFIEKQFHAEYTDIGQELSTDDSDLFKNNLRVDKLNGEMVIRNCVNHKIITNPEVCAMIKEDIFKYFDDYYTKPDVEFVTYSLQTMNAHPAFKKYNYKGRQIGVNLPPKKGESILDETYYNLIKK